MRLRTQLALAFLVLTVLPLGGIVLYSYFASERAFRQAVWTESRALAGEIETRLASTRQGLRDRLERLGDLSAAAADAVKLPEQPELSGQIAAQLAERIAEAHLPYLTAVEVVPAPPLAPVPPTPPAVPAAGGPSGEGLLGDLSCPIKTRLQIVGHFRAQIAAQALLDSAFAAIRRDQGEVPFALDETGKTYLATPADREALQGVPLSCDTTPDANWIVVAKKDPASGLCYGVARPIRRSLAEMRRAAVRNFGYGLGLVALCFVGIFPLSGRITRNLAGLMGGVEGLAGGDLAERVAVRSRDEFGRLGEAFNRMAAQLAEHQERLLAGERQRKEQEIERRLLEAEHARKSAELEQARSFQLSLLPRELPRRADLDVAVRMRTATEVGGDYYDFLTLDGGGLTVAIGDATGHGAAAGTLVTVVKGLFTGSGGDLPPGRFLDHANEVIRRMQLGRMAMALALVRLEGRRLTVAAAGMPPLLIHHREGGAVEEVCLPATPLGALAEPAYPERTVELAPGDVLLLMSDGFPERLNADGEPLGYPRAADLFAAAVAADREPEAILTALTSAGEAWSGGVPPHDDVTFVALRVH